MNLTRKPSYGSLMSFRRPRHDGAETQISRLHDAGLSAAGTFVAWGDGRAALAFLRRFLK